MEEKQLFDATAPFIVEIISGGTRRTTLNYPTDKQWIARAAAQKFLRHDLGRGKSSQDKTPIERHDLALYQDRLISVDNTDEPFDEFEASLVIERLMKAEVSEALIIEGDRIRVSLTVFGGAEVEHVFRMPKRKQVVEYGRAAVHHVHTPKGGETAISLDPSGTLYDALIVSSDGYATGTPVPIIHKDVAIVEVLKLQSPEA